MSGRRQGKLSAVVVVLRWNLAEAVVSPAVVVADVLSPLLLAASEELLVEASVDVVFVVDVVEIVVDVVESVEEVVKDDVVDDDVDAEVVSTLADIVDVADVSS